MTNRDILPAWGRILSGRKPLLSLEITKECPLNCPGCYAYAADHVGAGLDLAQLSDFRGKDLVARTLDLVRALRPVHVSIVGGEPLVRYRELDEILRELNAMRIETQVVTSAVRRIPEHWAGLANLHLVVSIDGLPAEHDVRRAPATYERILKHIAGHRVIVHCTVTRQMVRPGYLRRFCEYWSPLPEARKIWFSLYTPQQGEESTERLIREDREMVLQEIASLRGDFPKLHMPNAVLEGYVRPPVSPEQCIFSQVTACVSADLKSPITPCQIGGKPVCEECGCMASAGLCSVGNYRIAGLVPLSAIFSASRKLGQWFHGSSC